MSRVKTFVVMFLVIALVFGVLLGLIAVARPLANSIGVPWETARAFLVLFVGIVMLAGSLTFLAEQRRPSEKRKHEDIVEREAAYTIGDDGELMPAEEKPKKLYH
jgi:ACR3 family arsenite efflux pump ArsB